MLRNQIKALRSLKKFPIANKPGQQLRKKLMMASFTGECVSAFEGIFFKLIPYIFNVSFLY